MVAWASADELDFYAVKVDPGKERMAERILGYRKILARVPTRTYESRAHRKSKRKITITRPWLVGLVVVAFPKLDDDGKQFHPPWFALKQRIHIIRGPIGMDHKAIKLDHVGLMRLFDDIVFSDVEVRMHLKTYAVKDRVKVIEGPFAGFEAEVVAADESDLRILCDIFGRKTLVRIEAEQLDKIEPVAA